MATPAPHPLRFLIVRLAGRDFAVPAACLCGMMLLKTASLQPLHPTGPLRFSLLLGGHAVPVVFPHSLLSLEHRPPSARACLLLVRDPSRAPAPPPSGAAFALAVDSVSRLEEVPPSHYRAPGRIRLGDAWRDVLDPDQLYRAACAESASLVTK
jgi:hypothetical protein